MTLTQQLIILVLWTACYLYTLCKLTNRDLKDLFQSLGEDCTRYGTKHSSYVITMLCFIYFTWPISLLLWFADEWHERNKKKD